MLDKYSTIKEEDFSAKVRKKKQMKDKTVCYNKHFSWYSNYELLRAGYKPTASGK